MCPDPTVNPRLEAPDDVFVDEIVMADKSVEPHQKLFVLRSPRLERLLSHVVAFQKHIEIAERPFHDGRMSDEITGLMEKAKTLADAKEHSQSILRSTIDSASVGVLTLLDISKAQMDVASATNAYVDAKLAADHAEKKKQDMIDRLNVAKDSLRREQAFLEEMRSAMIISSPVKGHFKAFVVSGSFVKKGHVLGEIMK